MQVVSGPIGSPTVHFEAPPSKRVPAEMKRFLSWFNRTAPQGKEPLPAMTRAGIAHLYFESIHPFEDGNGRIGRAIAEKAIARASVSRCSSLWRRPSWRTRRAITKRLKERIGKSILQNGCVWFAGIALEAQRRSIAQVEFIIAKTKLLDRLRGHINERQQKALLRMFREGPKDSRAA